MYTLSPTSYFNCSNIALKLSDFSLSDFTRFCSFQIREHTNRINLCSSSSDSTVVSHVGGMEFLTADLQRSLRVGTSC